MGIVSSIVSILMVMSVHAQDSLVFGPTILSALQETSLKLPIPICEDEFENIEEAVLFPMRACEIFVTSSEPVVIPKEIVRLQFLEALAIDGPSSVALHPGLWTLQNLEELQMVNVGLTALPEAIRNLSKLNTLDVRGNTFTQEHVKMLHEWLPNAVITYE